MDSAADAEVLCGLVAGDLGAGVLEFLEEAGVDEAGVAGNTFCLVPRDLGSAVATLDSAGAALAAF